jgi:hypothetical protein
MSKNEAVSIAGRAVALYLFIWGLDAASYFPERLMQLQHQTTDFWHSYDMLSLALTVIRMAALFGAALFFFEGGQRAESFFLPAEKKAKSE